MKWNKLYKYPSSTRSLIQGSRHYDVNQEKLPSVTMILAATQSEEKRESLKAWQERVGKENSLRIRDQAAERGTAMHAYLEDYLNGKERVDLTPLGQEARPMAQQIIDKGLNNLEEILSIDGVDGFIVGPYDLSASMGKPGEFDYPDVVNALTKVKEVSKEMDAVSGFHVVQPKTEEVMAKIKEGYRFIGFSLDTLFLGKTCLSKMGEIRHYLQDVTGKGNA